MKANCIAGFKNNLDPIEMGGPLAFVVIEKLMCAIMLRAQTPRFQESDVRLRNYESEDLSCERSM